ncbi:unnamed protein product [Schistosoma margrebowiei]|uniref:Apoptosis regulator Bcl-2 family BH4 domain-containing protein n=1 Tax=Schistosoma margrebowiei TaxID=48269 RepID=A0A3P7VLN4_9TREM|nr:unnamed protein product [Schistosoma margrebowiei]
MNPYNIVQGKSFTRSVSISEPTSTPPECCITSHINSAIIGDCLPSIRSASGEGGSTTSDISFSPFSSAATAITPESPLPPDSNCFQSNPLASIIGYSDVGGVDFPVQHSTTTTSTPATMNMSTDNTNNDDVDVPISQPTENSPKPNHSNIFNQSTDHNQQNTSSSTSSPSLSSSLRQFNDDNNNNHDSIYNYNVLFQNPVTLRTINFLSHLLDSRLSPDWRTLLEYWQKNTAKLDLSSGISQSYSSTTHNIPNTATTTLTPTISRTDNTDFTRSSSSDQEVCAVKRFKPNSSSQVNFCLILYPPVKFCLFQPQNEIQPTSNEPSATTNTTILPSTSLVYHHQSHQSIPSTFISARLILCARNLADHFESRYRDKLGSLLEDVARLNSNSNSDNINYNIDDQSCTEETNKTTMISVDDNVTNVHDTNISVKSDSRIGDGDASGASSHVSDDSLQTRLEMARCQFHSVLEELFLERINWGRIIAMLAFLRTLCEVVEDNNKRMNYSVSHQSVQQYHGVSKSTDLPIISCEQVEHNDAVTSDCNKQLSSTDPSSSCSDKTTDRKLKDKNSETTVDPHQSNASDLRLVSFTRPCAADYTLWTTEFIHGPRGLWNWISSHGNWEGLINFESQRDETDQSTITSTTMGNNSLISLVTGNFTDDDTLRSLRNALTSVATIAVGAVGLVAAYRFFSRRL